MTNKAAIDFGNCNTVLSVWNDKGQTAEILKIPDFSIIGTFLIPSLIAYEPDGKFYIGSQAASKASEYSCEFRWMKRYISLRSPYKLRIGDKRIDAKQAAEDFLRVITAAAFSELDDKPDELILSVPVESFEHYNNWLLNEIDPFENMNIRLIDEASAAAAGYGLNLHPGDNLLVIDFGGSTLQSICVTVCDDETETGNCCRVLGKSGCSTGGMSLDRWIYQSVLKRLNLAENDPLIHHNSAALLRYCEAVKKQLSENESVIFDFFPDRSFLLSQSDLDSIFRENGLFETMAAVLEETIRNAEDHGLQRDELAAVLPIGGTSLVPAVKAFLTEHFPMNKIILSEPLGAVARGAAIIAGGVHIFDYIQHSYAIRYTDPYSGAYSFRTIIEKGTKYPVCQATTVMKLKASFDGQQQFGIAIYEIRESVIPVSHNEVFFDTDGSVHVLSLTEEEVHSEELFWMNQRNPLFLKSNNPAARGIPCFEVFFGVDKNKMLTITVLDATNNKHILNQYPLLRLV